MLVWSRWIKNQPRGFHKQLAFLLMFSSPTFARGWNDDGSSKICHATIVFIRLQHSKCQKGGLKFKCSFETEISNVLKVAQEVETYWKASFFLQILESLKCRERMSWRSSWRINTFNLKETCWKPAKWPGKCSSFTACIAYQHHLYLATPRYNLSTF